MRTLIFLSFVALVAIPACGTSSTTADPTTSAASPTSPTACTGAQECNPDQCVCSDGETFQTATICAQNTCSTGNDASFCASMCMPHGGVTTIRPSPNVATSAECDAWCSKGLALSCGTTKCDRYFFCGVPKHSCEAAARAALDCAVKKGQWACSSHSDSWSVGSSCSTFEELCTGAADAGTD